MKEGLIGIFNLMPVFMVLILMCAIVFFDADDD